VKWPNDLWLSGRKVSGILIESPADLPGCYVIGVGINANNRITDGPSEIHALATSMADNRGPVDRNDVLVEYLQRLFGLLDAFPDQWHDTVEVYRRYCVLTGQKVQLVAGSTSVVGACHGIDADGLLLIQSDHGLRSYACGTVRPSVT
jgi:BirA family biotin operon repressor/biotin-[acetyl-CoA-carboxylase] ligase